MEHLNFKGNTAQSILLFCRSKMFKETDRIKTPKGPGIITKLRKSSYSKSILYYVVKLDSGEDYLCPVDSAEEIKW